jgi:predicted transcriptional regulator
VDAYKPESRAGAEREEKDTQVFDVHQIVTLVMNSPTSAEPGHHIDEQAWKTLGCLQRMDRRGMEVGAQALSRASRDLLGQSVDGCGENAPAPWLAWYGGQLQGFASVFRCALLQQLPRNAEAIRGKKNARAILSALTDGTQNLSALSKLCEINDLSQMGREVDLLVDAGLVTTVKMGAKRWVSLTPLGKQAVEPPLDSVPSSPSKDPPRGMHAGDGGRGENKVRDIWVKKAT